jgi:transposase
LADKPADLVTIVDNSVGDVPQIKAQAFEKIVRLSDVSGESNEEISWEERRILVYSPTYAKRLKVVFKEKIAKALDALALILVPQKGRKKLKTRTAVALKIDSILKKYQVQNFVDVQINEQVQQVEVRGHLNRPARTETILHFSLDCKANEIKVKQHLEEMGWQIYACNAPKESLSTEQAILCYRNEYKIEHKFDELLNRITALMPVYLQKPKRIKALIRLLLLALKYVSLIQFTVRKALETTKQKIKELYAGNPTRATNQPTTNMMLRAFRNITLVIVPIGEKNFVKISDLKPHQLKILELLNIPPEVYSGFNKLSFSHYDFSET